MFFCVCRIVRYKFKTIQYSIYKFFISIHIIYYKLKNPYAKVYKIYHIHKDFIIFITHLLI